MGKSYKIDVETDLHPSEALLVLFPHAEIRSVTEWKTIKANASPFLYVDVFPDDGDETFGLNPTVTFAMHLSPFSDWNSQKEEVVAAIVRWIKQAKGGACLFDLNYTPIILWKEDELVVDVQVDDPYWLPVVAKLIDIPYTHKEIELRNT